MSLIITKNDNNPITLNITVMNGHYAVTTIMFNGNALPPIHGSFKDHVLGTNNGLKHNSITVITSVMITNDTRDTEVLFELNGAAAPDSYTSKKTAPAGISNVQHPKDYMFI